MKYLLFSLLLLFSSARVLADDVQTIDASTVSKMTFSGDQVTINYKNGTSATVDMATVTIDFSNVTSIEERMSIAREAGLEGKPVYSLSGKPVGNSVAGLPKGVYIVNGQKLIIK